MIYNEDNLIVFRRLLAQGEKFKIVYFDPPYNTGNQFNYNDKFEVETWIGSIDERLSIAKQLLTDNGCLMFSISEESLVHVLTLLNKHFAYIYPPFVWQTKNVLNQNKVNSVNSVVHEYVIVASNNLITSHLEELEDETLQEKCKNYPLSVYFKNSPSLIEKEKSYLHFKQGDFEISKEDREDKKHQEICGYLKQFNLNFENQIFQKRTAQKGHGAYRYYEGLKSIPYVQDDLYILLNVKDKNNLNGKMLMNNSYFQSIQKGKVKIKIPSFLGFYQGGAKGFQTAKPVELMVRLFKAFSDEGDHILDAYSGSGNVIKAAKSIKRKILGIELDKKTFLELKK